MKKIHMWTYKSNSNCTYVIQTKDESIIQITFILGIPFKIIKDNSLTFNKYGILILLKLILNILVTKLL